MTNMTNIGQSSVDTKTSLVDVRPSAPQKAEVCHNWLKSVPVTTADRPRSTKLGAIFAASAPHWRAAGFGTRARQTPNIACPMSEPASKCKGDEDHWGATMFEFTAASTLISSYGVTSAASANRKGRHILSAWRRGKRRVTQRARARSRTARTKGVLRRCAPPPRQVAHNPERVGGGAQHLGSGPNLSSGPLAAMAIATAKHGSPRKRHE